MTITNIPLKIIRGVKNVFCLCAFGAFMSATAMLSGLNKDFNRFSVSSLKFDLHKKNVSSSSRETTSLHAPEIKNSIAGLKAANVR